MQHASVRELRTHASALLRRVRDEGETIEITMRGEAVARLVPIDSPIEPADAAAWLAELDRLVARIDAAMQGKGPTEAERD